MTADFYCHKAGLVIEIDGEIHGSQKDYDAERETLFASTGLRTLRFENRDVLENTEAVINAIQEACRRAVKNYKLMLVFTAPPANLTMLQHF